MIICKNNNKKKTDRKLRKRGNSAKSREHIQMDRLSSHFQPHLSVKPKTSDRKTPK